MVSTFSAISINCLHCQLHSNDYSTSIFTVECNRACVFHFYFIRFHFVVCVCVFFFASCVFGCLISVLCARIVYTLQKKGKVLSTVHSKFTSIQVKHASLEYETWNGHVARPSSRHFPKMCFCRFYTIQHI